jgi:flagellin-like hook-associated protein FlgL
MSISIQSSASALATLESLTTQAGAGAAASLLDSTPTSDPAASVIDLSGGAVGGISSGLATSASIADAAVSSGTLIEGLLAQMRQDALTASDPNLGGGSRAALDQGFKDGLAQIQKAVASAGVGGVNLIDGSVNGSANVSAATLTGVNLSLGGPLIGVGANASLSDPASAAAIASQLGTAIDNVGQAVGQISAQGQAIESHLSLVAQAGLALSPGVAGQVNNGLSGDGARLAALQVQQQLSLTAASLGNQTPNAVLSLFRAA